LCQWGNTWKKLDLINRNLQREASLAWNYRQFHIHTRRKKKHQSSHFAVGLLLGKTGSKFQKESTFISINSWSHKEKHLIPKKFGWWVCNTAYEVYLQTFSKQMRTYAIFNDTLGTI